MAKNNLIEYKQDKTLTYFNNLYLEEFTVPHDVDTTILGFFEQLTNNKETAKALASSIIQTSYQQKMDPMQVLTEFMSMPKGRINEYLAVFLNLNRIGTSLLKVGNTTTTSKYIKRLVLP
jgi:hypothetical protein